MLSALSSALAIIVTALLWSARSRWRRGQRFAASRRAVLGVAGMPMLFGAALVGSNLYTYHALTRELPVAEIAFKQLAEDRFLAELRITDEPPRRYELRGDEWQLDARMIKWLGVGALVGLDPLYRLDRLSGRYSDAERARATPPSLYDLADESALDLWTLARHYPVGLIDAAYGSSVFLPMEDGTRYQVNITASGLIARPSTPGS